MDLDEVTGGIPNFSAWDHSDKIKLFAWYLHTQKGQDRFNQADIRACYDQLSLDKPSNVSPYLQRLTESTPRQMLRDGRGFYLEKRNREEFDAKYGVRHTAVQIHSLLSELPSKVSSPLEKAFLDEALICLRYGAPRAAIVMTWNLAFSHLCDFVLARHLSAFNTEWPVRFPKGHSNSPIKAIGNQDDFGHLKESEVLEIAKSSNIISANIYKILKEKLDRRNIAAHPNSVVFTTLQAEEFISDLINNAVLKLV